MLVRELFEDVFDKPLIIKVSSQLACAGMDTSPQNIVKFIPSADVRDVSKYLKEVSKKRSLESLSPAHFPSIVHRVIATLYWYAQHKSQHDRTIDNIEKVSELKYSKFLSVFSDHLADIKKIFNGHIGLSSLPKLKTSWVNIENRQQELRSAFSTLARGKEKTSSADVARYLIQKLDLSDDRESLRRAIDKMLEAMPELEKFRAVGSSTRGKDVDYGDGIKTW